MATFLQNALDQYNRGYNQLYGSTRAEPISVVPVASPVSAGTPRDPQVGQPLGAPDQSTDPAKLPPTATTSLATSSIGHLPGAQLPNLNLGASAASGGGSSSGGGDGNSLTQFFQNLFSQNQQATGPITAGQGAYGTVGDFGTPAASAGSAGSLGTMSGGGGAGAGAGIGSAIGSIIGQIGQGATQGLKNLNFTFTNPAGPLPNPAVFVPIQLAPATQR